MKIALVYPSRQSDEKQMPLGLGYLASFILSKNSNIKVKALDTGVARKKEITSFIRDDYDLVGISVTSKAYAEAVNLAKMFKEHNPNVVIVLGGPHVSIMKQEIMREPLIDLAIYGEGELSFDDLIKVLSRTNNQPTARALAKINGLIYRNGSQVVVNAPREPIKNLDTIPFPAFSLFPLKRYPGKYPMITSRGCPFSCVFCVSSQIWGRKWRARSPENIIAEVKYLLKNFEPRPIDFHDDGFNISLERVKALCDKFIEEKVKIPWGVRGFRADMVNSKVAEKMHRSGCSHVAIGIESANNEMLIQMGKNESIETINKGITILRSAGIDVVGQFMIGNPGETLETVLESMKFVEKSDLNKAIFGSAVPFPNSGLWDYVNEHGSFLVEPDCTKFEALSPRVIFETPEFTKEERLKALKLVEEAGLAALGCRSTGIKISLGSVLRSVCFKYLYGWLPRSISYKLYFFLRSIRTKVLSSKKR